MAPKPSRDAARASAAAPDTQVLAVLPVEGVVLFPGGKLTVPVRRPGHLLLVEEALRDDQGIVLVAQRQVGVEDAGPEDLYRVGTAARVLNVANRAGGGAALEVKGVRRVRLVDDVQRSPFLRARVEALADAGGGAAVEKQAQALRAACAKLLGAERGPEAAERVKGCATRARWRTRWGRWWTRRWPSSSACWRRWRCRGG